MERNALKTLAGRAHVISSATKLRQTVTDHSKYVFRYKNTNPVWFVNQIISLLEKKT